MVSLNKVPAVCYTYFEKDGTCDSCCSPTKLVYDKPIYIPSVPPKPDAVLNSQEAQTVVRKISSVGQDVHKDDLGNESSSEDFDGVDD